jgi:hypothetical protein
MPTELLSYLTEEEAARLLGVSYARVSLWIGEGRLPIAARSEYAGFLLRAHIVETVGRRLAEATPAALRISDPEPSSSRGSVERHRKMGAAPRIASPAKRVASREALRTHPVS